MNKTTVLVSVKYLDSPDDQPIVTFERQYFYVNGKFLLSVSSIITVC